MDEESGDTNAPPTICLVWILFQRNQQCYGRHCQFLHPAKCQICPRALQSACPHPRVYKASAGVLAWNESHPEQAFPLHESADQVDMSRHAAKLLNPNRSPDATIGLHAWLLQTGSTLRLDGACRTFKDKAGHELIFASFEHGIYDSETLQVEIEGQAVVRYQGEEYILRKRNLHLPPLLLHGIKNQGVRHGMDCIANNLVKVGSSYPHGVYHINADREDAYQKLDFYNGGCVLLTSTAGLVVDRSTKTSAGKEIKNPYNWVGVAYKGVVVSQVRNIGREYVVHPRSLMILGALFDKTILRSFLL